MCQLPGRIKWLKPVFAQRRAKQPQFFALEKLTEIQELRGHRRRAYSQCASNQVRSCNATFAWRKALMARPGAR